ncbi:M1 family metallopeptidase [Chitinophaga rhizophila]|uniref:Aminopeptidase N n=1 Tax=Chitinophaga rhizophila TaxID=2866212 RepID=A0ABS7GMX5_9BACT|nr:M1 family metallopeptidase [Chitinophaga rhizophila]MBW8688394.1 HEAT repeat domain-containing protein [Chitinophaga rhizophila]
MFKPLKHTLKSVLVAGLTGFIYYTPATAQQAPSQQEDPALTIYRATSTKVHDLTHTKLDVRFDYAKRYLIGKAWLTLKPHFYTTDSLTLDAKAMDIKQVAVVKGGKNIPLKFNYDSTQLHIGLDKPYQRTEPFTIYIDYIARPEEVKSTGSSAITDAKGLYFINPDSAVKNKPVQIWTQGETESSSAWFPTIDRTNQKTTQEISITVDKKYATLSNGKLMSQKNNADGTRTDYWKMDLPHAPYLFMMAVGDFAIIKDQWKGKEVNYYLEKEYAPYAKAIFGNTPEMLTFYSNLLGYDYPWVKYSQVVVRDYVSGAMENTTATIHGDFLQKTDRELLDNNNFNEAVVAHELFHHWFGDLVTAESWSNLTLNESFADYSEYLWMAYKYGKDAGDDHAYKAMQSYQKYAQYSGDKDLVRYHYHDKEDMFDAISYQKGGRILHMLRNFVGDSAFFKSLNVYLKTNAFKSAEASQLRLAFEEVTGQDLNWFFNQWYFGQGYPVLDIRSSYNESDKTVTVTVEQTQTTNKIFQLPVAIDIYAGGKKVRHKVTIYNQKETFTLPCATQPDLVNFDGDKVLLAERKEHRDINSYIFQYAHAPEYLDRREAIQACLKEQSTNPAALKVVVAALKDKFYGLRALAVSGLKLVDPVVKEATLTTLQELAKKDNNATVRAAALTQLGTLKDVKLTALFEAAAKDRSYAAAGAALESLGELDLDKAYALAKQMEADSKGALSGAITNIYAQKGNESDIAFFAKTFNEASGQDKLDAAIQYLSILSIVDNTDQVVKGVGDIKDMAMMFNNKMVNNYLITLLQPIAKSKEEKAAIATPDKKTALLKQSEYLKQVANDLKN